MRFLEKLKSLAFYPKAWAKSEPRLGGNTRLASHVLGFPPLYLNQLLKTKIQNFNGFSEKQGYLQPQNSWKARDPFLGREGGKRLRSKS